MKKNQRTNQLLIGSQKLDVQGVRRIYQNIYRCFKATQKGFRTIYP
tara:strand:- start:1047 stop:1184 length:138 start_codon:yes stop_codon:yes gene_type:complete